MTDHSRLLNALKMNAAFSTLSVITLFAAGDWIAAQLGLSGAASIYSVAVVLALFALQLWNIVRTRNIQRWEITAIIVADLGWVVTSAVLVVLYYSSLTAAGLILVDTVAAAVLFFAILQIRGLRQVH